VRRDAQQSVALLHRLAQRNSNCPEITDAAVDHMCAMTQAPDP
jgi:hypothetical protein